MQPVDEYKRTETRRHFLKSSAVGIGTMALADLLSEDASAANRSLQRDMDGGIMGMQQMKPTAKRVIYLFQSGGLSQLDTYDYKPNLKDHAGKDLPASVRMGQRLTGFTNKQKTLPIVPSKFRFQQYGESGTWFSELLPHLGKQADEICLLNSMHSEAINHDPARTLLQTGFQLAGRPSLGTWVSYGLGSPCHDLPAFMVLTSIGSCKRTPQPVSARLWGSGFLPSQYQGVKLQSIGDPILSVSNPAGLDENIQGRTIRALSRLNQIKAQQIGDPEIDARTRQYEMAFRMQTSVPDLMDFSDEPKSVLEMYGAQPGDGSYASNCLLARRLAERGVRFIHLYHRGWDHHGGLVKYMNICCGLTDKPTWALLTDLKQRGMLDDTLVIWGGEFGRTPMFQGKGGAGRDHHIKGFSMWMAGGGIRGGITYGATDELGYNAVEDVVHVRDLHATMLHLLGIDHRRFSVKFQGLDMRLTGVEEARVVKSILT